MIENLKNIIVDISVELGRIKLPVKKILSLKRGSIIKLNKLSGSKSNLLINNVCIGEGEINIIDDYRCIILTDIFSVKVENYE